MVGARPRAGREPAYHGPAIEHEEDRPVLRPTETQNSPDWSLRRVRWQ
jgi:hypothetical protein